MSLRRRPTEVSIEADARWTALREHIGWRGPIDQDGYATGDYDVLPPLVDQWRAAVAEADSGRPTW